MLFQHDRNTICTANLYMAGALKVRQAYTSNHHKQPINGTIFEKKKKMNKKKTDDNVR